MDSPGVMQAQAMAALRAKYGVSFNKNMDLGTLVSQWAQAQTQNPQLANQFPVISGLMQSANGVIQTLNIANGLEKGFATALQIIQTTVVATQATTGFAPLTPANPLYAAAAAALITAQQTQQTAAQALQLLTQQIVNALMS